MTATTAAATLALVTLALAATAARARLVDFCYAHLDAEERYLKFASKTAYDLARDTSRGAGGPEVLPHCEPKQFWLLNRHGTRYPGKNTVIKMENVLFDLRDSIITNHAEGDGRLCDPDLDALKSWRLTADPSQANDLTAQGEQDLLLIAERLRDRFPTLLRRPYTARDYQFRHTKEVRTKQSARKFAEGLFGDRWEAVLIPEPPANDTLLQPYATCASWLAGDANDPPEFRALLDGPLVDVLLRNVSTRLGFRAPLKHDDIEVIYNMCRYDKAWTVGKTSPWCAAFSKDELLLLEYAEDLRYYYKSGYGGEDNVKLGCPLVKDLVTRFNALSAGEQQPAGVFYFAHSSTLHTLQAALGAFRDAQPLRADNYAQQRARLWRVSDMGPFAGNLAAIFYRCDEGERERVLFLSAEGPLNLGAEAGCRVGLCPWSRVRTLLQPVADTCHLQWCDAGSHAPRSAPAPAAALAAAAAVLTARALLAL